MTATATATPARIEIDGKIFNPYSKDFTSFESLPEDWICPECGSPKSSFEIYVG